MADIQDIGGCRAVVGTNRQVGALGKLYQSGSIRHELERRNNYIESPTSDGYRSLHLVYRYSSERNERYNGQRIEIQMRSRLQHAWATTVEVIDTFANQLLKINQGGQQWSRFFVLMGGWLALRERTSPVPGVSTNQTELINELRELAHDLNVEDRLLAIKATAQYVGRQTGEALYYLINLNIANRTLRITRYARDEAAEAAEHLADLELEYRGHPDKDVLLASASSVKELRKMYPNYSVDTEVFVRELRRALR